MSVRVRAKLPKGDGNGLASWETRLADNPDTPIPIVGLILPDTIEQRPHDDDDPRVVKCVFVGIEAIADQADAKTVEGLLYAVFEARTGRLTLPFEEDDNG